jgi:hypothetical protein
VEEPWLKVDVTSAKLELEELNINCSVTTVLPERWTAQLVPLGLNEMQPFFYSHSY